MTPDPRRWWTKLVMTYATAATAVFIGYIGYDIKRGIDEADARSVIVDVNKSQDERLYALQSDLTRLQASIDGPQGKRESDAYKPIGLGCVCIKELPKGEREFQFCVASAISTNCSPQNLKICESRHPDHHCH